MNKQITIRNNYHKRISCEGILGRPFAMEGGEIKVMDFSIGTKLLQNVWITEVGKEINSECLPYMEKIPIVDILLEKPIDIPKEKPIDIPKEKPIETKKVDKLNNEIK